MQQLENAIKVIQKLRDPENGCPWDLKQTHQTLLKYLVEEAYEFIYAAEKNDIAAMEEELGDILLQVLLHAQIASENQKFDIFTVAQKLADKMIYRHPHVFQSDHAKISQQQVVENWEKLKSKKKKNKSFFKEDEAYLPSLLASHKIGERSSRVNFDWDNINDVFKKVEEELNEFKVEFAKKDQLKMQEELGDLLFTIAQLARHMNSNAEELLRQANLKFIKRFSQLEAQIHREGLTFEDATSEQLEVAWQKIKLQKS